MPPFTTFTGIVAPLDRDDVDTDAIIPKQFMKSIARTGFGPNLFDAWRYLDVGKPGMDNTARPKNPDFVLNDPRYAGASILLARRNFGCGSSREHAPWALLQAGFKVIIASSFADIFMGNCSKNGILAIALGDGAVDGLFARAGFEAPLSLRVDLEQQCVSGEDGLRLPFAISPFVKANLLAGSDDIALSLAHADEVKAFEERRHARQPWLARPLHV
ncbi:3-isopropylmalate dehydratase small subunit [uncultured Massilia sp.]|uniref:3-isopropylmalate dehydratase small subunit n=1 Tax=uncultured Massilia sp. TaxID=169973 RepID=UPI0025845062|nr:3-isopropylmalate dehydratase small subunit [uncultured Massilia sp.]